MDAGELFHSAHQPALATGIALRIASNEVVAHEVAFEQPPRKILTLTRLRLPGHLCAWTEDHAKLFRRKVHARKVRSCLLAEENFPGRCVNEVKSISRVADTSEHEVGEVAI